MEAKRVLKEVNSNATDQRCATQMIKTPSQMSDLEPQGLSRERYVIATKMIKTPCQMFDLEPKGLSRERYLITSQMIKTPSLVSDLKRQDLSREKYLITLFFFFSIKCNA